MITWIDVLADRLQGEYFDDTDESYRGRVLLIQHHYNEYAEDHWCGYLEFPRKGLPPPNLREEINSWCSEDVTFFGSRGPIIDWFLQGLAGHYNIPAPLTVGSYWLGFDASPEVPVKTMMIRLNNFARTFYQEYLKHDEVSHYAKSD